MNVDINVNYIYRLINESIFSLKRIVFWLRRNSRKQVLRASLGRKLERIEVTKISHFIQN
jgi:hypothetical protein